MKFAKLNRALMADNLYYVFFPEALPAELVALWSGDSRKEGRAFVRGYNCAIRVARKLGRS